MLFREGQNLISLACVQVAALLNETLLLLGYAALLHPGNQAVLRWGKSPTILHKVIAEKTLQCHVLLFLGPLRLAKIPSPSVSFLILYFISCSVDVFMS
jgi:hypothetical protein